MRGSMSNYYDDYDDIDEMEDEYDLDDPADDMVDEQRGIRDSDAEDNDYGQPLSRKPPELPQDKDRAIQDSFDRIKSIEFDLEKTKKVLHATVIKQMQMAETLEAVTEPDLRRRKFCT